MFNQLSCLFLITYATRKHMWRQILSLTASFLEVRERSPLFNLIKLPFGFWFLDNGRFVPIFINIATDTVLAL
jgi:hypothetical protein